MNGTKSHTQTSSTPSSANQALRRLVWASALTVSALAFSSSALAQTGNHQMPAAGEREITLSGAGASDRNWNAGAFGVSGDYGWYQTPETMFGIRQSINYASIEGQTITNDFWNGATRAYANYHFGATNVRPFLGASIGGIYGDGVNTSAFAGLEGGFKFYVADRTFVLARAEYQWYFDNARDIDNTFDRGSWAYTLGIGYNF